MHCAGCLPGCLLLCMTTFAPRSIENLRVHKLPLPHENVKLRKFLIFVARHLESTIRQHVSTLKMDTHPPPPGHFFFFFFFQVGVCGPDFRSVGLAIFACERGVL